MGTRFAIQCHHDDQVLIQKAISAAFAEAEHINDAASDYIADSELLSLTKHPAGTAVKVSPLLFGLLEQARFYAEKTHGLFDPTIGPLTKLWRESRRRKKLPDAETLAKARAAVGWQKLTLDREKSTATFAVDGMRLDLGGIAKGQAADRMLEILKNYGIPSSSVTAGGDVRLGDPPPGEKGWRVGIRTFDKNVDSGTLFLANCAVSTSGDLQQSVEIDGVRYAHIIDPATGLGLTQQVARTIIAPTAALSDALDAACCIASREVGEKLAKDLGATLLPG
jgi:thiamine biosynthesis lipoprotein